MNHSMRSKLANNKNNRRPISNKKKNKNTSLDKYSNSNQHPRPDFTSVVNRPYSTEYQADYQNDITISYTSSDYQAFYGSLTGNGLYHPDTTATSTTWRASALIANMYTTYMVSSSKVSLEVYNSNNTYGDVRVYLYPADVAYTSAIYNEQQISNTPFCRHISMMTGASNVSKLTNMCATNQVFGCPPNAMHFSTAYNGALGATNPSNIWYWNIVVFPLKNGTFEGSLSLYIRIRVLYNCILKDKQEVIL